MAELYCRFTASPICAFNEATPENGKQGKEKVRKHQLEVPANKHLIPRQADRCQGSLVKRRRQELSIRNTCGGDMWANYDNYQTGATTVAIVGKQGVRATCMINHVSNTNNFHIGSR